jgi:hypothetical protein
MLTVTFLIPTVFLAVLWFTYRRNRRRELVGDGYRPEGKIRWSGDGMQDVGP